MIRHVAPGTTGLVVSTLDHAGGLPAVERIIREIGRPATYRHTAKDRRSDICSVQITLAGAGRVWADGRQNGPGTVVPRGRCLAFRYGQSLAYAADPTAGSWDFIYINLCGGAAHESIDELTAGRRYVLPCDPGHPAIVRLLDLAHGPGVRHRRLGLADSARIACEVLLALSESRQAPGMETSDALEHACSYLVRHLAKSVDVADAAEDAGVSREHLTRLFRRRLGLAPAAWLRRERLRQAELLIRGGSLPLQAIARRTGFATASHFVQAFRRRYGTTPGSLRTG